MPSIGFGFTGSIPSLGSITSVGALGAVVVPPVVCPGPGGVVDVC